jgi:hypothetical protein
MHRGDDVVAGWCGIDKHQKNKEKEKRVWLLM